MPLRLVGDGKAKMCGQKAGSPLQSAVALVDDRCECLENVRNGRGDVQGDGDVVGRSPGGQSGRFVEEDLVRSGLDESRREPFEVGEDWADGGIGGRSRLCASCLRRSVSGRSTARRELHTTAEGGLASGARP
jgi:hypothetical protein